MNCIYCGDPIDPSKPPHATDDGPLCAGCWRQHTTFTDDGNPHVPEPKIESFVTLGPLVDAEFPIRWTPEVKPYHELPFAAVQGHPSCSPLMSLDELHAAFTKAYAKVVAKLMPAVDLVKPDHIVTGPPVDDDETAEPPEQDATPIEPNRDDWPAYETGHPIAYADARNLNAADISREIRRMT